MKNKLDLFNDGVKLLQRFAVLNSVELPTINKWDPADPWPFSVCAYFRPKDGIVINLAKCAHIGMAGPAWSYPGHIVDRTPYGVLAHELGHYIDVLMSGVKGKYYGDHSVNMRASTDEQKLTSYCPNSAEWFAEMFRLFITNPDLLRLIRPETYSAIARDFKPAEERDWAAVLLDAPERTFNVARNKIIAAQQE